jgi:hypothetical protein
MTRWVHVTVATALLIVVAGPCPGAELSVPARNPWPDAYAGDKGPSRVRFDTRLGDTAPMTEAELVPALLNAIDQLSKYPRAVSVPEIRRIPHVELAQMVCGGPCPARATYRPGEGIYLDDTLKPETNPFDRSVLLHELVHFVQEMANEHGDMRPCLRWYYREQEAYAIQKTFLVIIGSPVRVAYSAQGDACQGEPVTSSPK